MSVVSQPDAGSVASKEMNVERKTKARQLMQIAYATYLRNEPDIAKDIFILAMEEPTAASEFGQQPTRAELKRRMDEAIAAGDYETAADQLQAMEEIPGQQDEDFIPLVEDDEEETEEAALSPGDFVEDPPAPDLAPAQVASLVTLARRIKAEGHADLAGRITKALGL